CGSYRTNQPAKPASESQWRHWADAQSCSYLQNLIEQQSGISGQFLLSSAKNRFSFIALRLNRTLQSSNEEETSHAFPTRCLAICRKRHRAAVRFVELAHAVEAVRGCSGMRGKGTVS